MRKSVLVAAACLGLASVAQPGAAWAADDGDAVAAFARRTDVKPFDPRWAPSDPGCSVPEMVATGGAPFPTAKDVLAVRWTGYANFELAYKGHVLMLDAYINRGSIFAPLGFKADEVQTVDAILIGHGHSDHMSDAASIAKRTGAIVVGAPVTVEKLIEQKLPREQIRTATGTDGAVLRFGPFTVRPALGLHGSPPSDVTAAFREALEKTTRPLTEEEAAQQSKIRARGTSDPRVSTEGTIAYHITLDNGFTIMYRDSGGRVTDHEKKLMKDRGGKVDLGLIAVSSAYLNDLTIAQALEHLKAYRPSVYMPGHHDAAFNGLWRATSPLFQAANDKYPGIATVAPSYREPVCFQTSKNLAAKS